MDGRRTDERSITGTSANASAISRSAGRVGFDGRWVATPIARLLPDSRSAQRLARGHGARDRFRDGAARQRPGASRQVTIVNFTVDVFTIERPIVVEAYADSILDPTVVASVQRIGGEELRRFPVTTLEEAVSLSAARRRELPRRAPRPAGVRARRPGVKNQLDASTGPLGVRIPPDLLTEASLSTNGFSALRSHFGARQRRHQGRRDRWNAERRTRVTDAVGSATRQDRRGVGGRPLGGAPRSSRCSTRGTAGRDPSTPPRARRPRPAQRQHRPAATQQR